MESTLNYKREAIEELARRNMKRSLRRFFRATEPATPYVYGKHTYTLLAACQHVTNELNAGRSCFLIVNLPYRHGKSDISSRRFPVWHLVNRPEDETMLLGYNHKLAGGFSYDCRELMRTVGPEYGLHVRLDRSSIDEWKLLDHKGSMVASGIDGTITGKGANLIVIDDPYKNAEEAESQKIRDKVWEAFSSVVMTRRAPLCGVVIVMNRWHEDDICGRIIRINDPESVEYNPKFPKFEVVKCPMKAEDGSWLSPERWPISWYEQQEATLTAHAWSALAQQDPKPRVGNYLRADLCQIIKELPQGLRWIRGWDLASSIKEVVKDRPDFTVGVKSAVKFVDGRPFLFIAHVERFQALAAERDRRIIATALQDDEGTAQRMECVGAYKDCFDYVSQGLSGKRSISKFDLPEGDKLSRASVFEAAFEAGNVYLLEGGWNRAFTDELKSFPKGMNDDQVDGMVASAYEEIKARQKTFIAA